MYGEGHGEDKKETTCSTEMLGCHYSPEAVFREVEDIAAAPNKKELHDRVVQRIPLARKQVEVPRDEHSNIECLTFKRYA